MQAMVKLERSESTKSTTGKPGKMKELQMSNSNLKRRTQCRTGLCNWIFPAQSFPAVLPGAWAACVLSPVWISVSVPLQAGYHQASSSSMVFSISLSFYSACSEPHHLKMGHVKIGHIILKPIQKTALRNIFLSLNSVPLLHLCPLPLF